MKILSNDFFHLDEISYIYTNKNLNGGISPSLRWFNYPANTQSFVILMINMKTNKIYWGLVLPNTFINLMEGEVTGFEIENSFGLKQYNPPDDVDDVVTYIIKIFAMNKNYDEIQDIRTINENNIIDKAYIKFIYSGY